MVQVMQVGCRGDRGGGAGDATDTAVATTGVASCICCEHAAGRRRRARVDHPCLLRMIKLPGCSPYMARRFFFTARRISVVLGTSMPRRGMSATASASDAPCAKLPPSYLLSFTAMKNAASNGTVFVTFTDNRLSPFAINWARQLHAIGLRSLVGTAELLGESAESALSAAGARIFCADRVGLMAANGQAGRWAEAQLVLRLARRLSLSVLLSDADIAWIRNPLSYFDAVRASHPGLDLLMMTDRAFNGYSSAPLKIQPATITPSHSGLHGLRRSKARSLLAGGAAPSSSPGGIDLELEPAYESSISYNIGVIWFCAHALVPLEEMLGRWVVAVGGGSGAGVVAGRASGSGTANHRHEVWWWEAIIAAVWHNKVLVEHIAAMVYPFAGGGGYGATRSRSWPYGIGAHQQAGVTAWAA